MELLGTAHWLTRLPAIVACIAAVVALSFVFIRSRRAHRRTAARKVAERKCRELVRNMRRCPQFTRQDDRLLAERFSKELAALVEEHKFALHEVGTNQKEIEKILYMVREPSTPRPRMPSVKPPEPRLPAAVRGAIPLGTDVVRRPASIPLGERWLDPDAIAATPAPAVAAPPEPASAPAIELATDDFDIDEAEPVDAPPRSGTVSYSDPITALRSVDDGELDEYVDQRFAAITDGK